MDDCLLRSFPGLDVELGEGKVASWVPHRQHWGHGMALGSCLQGWVTSSGGPGRTCFSHGSPRGLCSPLPGVGMQPQTHVMN